MHVHVHSREHTQVHVHVCNHIVNQPQHSSTHYSFPHLNILRDHFLYNLVVLVPLGVDGGHEHGSAPAVWYAGNSQEVSFQGRLLLSLHI